MTGAVDWKTRAWVVAALAVILGAGLAGGVLLQRYDEQHGFRNEAARIAEVLALAPGMDVGDVRAGSGKWTVDMARRVAPGQVYATAGPNPAHELYQAVAAANLDNVTVITRAPGPTTGRLPIDCCDAVLIRAVYHDFTDRTMLNANLFRSVRAGGLLAIIDFGEGTPEHASGHGIRREQVTDELRAAGFDLEQIIDDWAGNAYCILFRKRAVRDTAAGASGARGAPAPPACDRSMPRFRAVAAGD